MEVEMGHGLLAGLTDIGHHPVTRAGEAQLLGELGNDGEDVAHDGGGLLRHSGHGLDVGLGHHQEVGGGLGVYVEEGIAQLVLIDLFAGDLPGRNSRGAALSLMRLWVRPLGQ